MHDLGIAGRKAIVCGSSRGLGRACAVSLAKAGVQVWINGRDPDRLQAAAAEMAKDTDSRIGSVAADVTTPEGQQALLGACPQPDILVTNAAGPPFRNFRALDRESLFEGLGMNMVAPIELIQRVIDGMVDRRFGRIVNITSISVRMPISGLDLSSGARAGLTAFIAGVAREVAHADVTINNLQPGYFDTDRYRAGINAWAESQNLTPAEVARERAQQVPAKRIGRPEELGDACAFLCSRNAGYITGQSLLLDGGLFPSAF
jgi:3-oxoacyl-[acyl-carrier protein] reductase